jgi:hypothetical protein
MNGYAFAQIIAIGLIVISGPAVVGFLAYKNKL